MRLKHVLINGSVVILFVAAVIIGLRLFYQDQPEAESKEIKSIEIHKIKLYMTQDEVEAMYGEGPDRTFGCFGCGMNFVYPELKTAGRYSETLDRVSKSGTIDERISPKVKLISTADASVSILGVHAGDSIGDARLVLEKQGYQLQTDANDRYYHYFYKGNSPFLIHSLMD